jgi:hypothetical protein
MTDALYTWLLRMMKDWTQGAVVKDSLKRLLLFLKEDSDLNE